MIHVGYLGSRFRYFQDIFVQKPGPTLSLLVQVDLEELYNMYSSLFLIITNYALIPQKQN